MDHKQQAGPKSKADFGNGLAFNLMSDLLALWTRCMWTYSFVCGSVFVYIQIVSCMLNRPKVGVNQAIAKHMEYDSGGLISAEVEPNGEATDMACIL